jgi:tetratricopeptide (TPR) repeat protein
MPLGLKPGQNLVSSRDIAPEIYQEFLRIRAEQRASAGYRPRLEAAEELEKLLSRAPNFAKAWAFLSNTYLAGKLLQLYNNTVEPPKDAREQLLLVYDKAEKAAREAIRLDETEVLAYATLALVEDHRNNWVAAEDLLRKGQSLDPYDPGIWEYRRAFWAKPGESSRLCR